MTGRLRSLGLRAFTSPVMAAVLLVAACADDDDVTVTDARMSPDGRTLALTVATCHREPEADVEETDEEVRITVRPSRKSNGDDCADTVIMYLRRPLGERRLVDSNGGRTGEGGEIPVLAEPYLAQSG